MSCIVYKDKNLLKEIYEFVSKNEGIKIKDIISKFKKDYLLMEKNKLSPDVQAIIRKVKYLISEEYLIMKNRRIYINKDKKYKEKVVRMKLSKLFDRNGRIKGIYRHQEIKLVS